MFAGVTPSVKSAACGSGTNAGSTSGDCRACKGPQLNREHVVCNPAPIREASEVAPKDAEDAWAFGRRNSQVQPQQIRQRAATESREPWNDPRRDAREKDGDHVDDRRLASACRGVHADDRVWVIRIGRSGAVLRQLFLRHLNRHGGHIEPVGPIDSWRGRQGKHVEIPKRSEVELIED